MDKESPLFKAFCRGVAGKTHLDSMRPKELGRVRAAINDGGGPAGRWKRKKLKRKTLSFDEAKALTNFIARIDRPIGFKPKNMDGPWGFEYPVSYGEAMGRNNIADNWDWDIIVPGIVVPRERILVERVVGWVTDELGNHKLIGKPYGIDVSDPVFQGQIEKYLQCRRRLDSSARVVWKDAAHRHGVTKSASTRYYHGTTTALGRLKELLPPSVTGVLQEVGRKKNLGKVFFTSSPRSASIYAGRAKNVLGGDPVVYEVAPRGLSGVETLNASRGTEVFMADAADVLRVVTGEDVMTKLQKLASGLRERAVVREVRGASDGYRTFVLDIGGKQIGRMHVNRSSSSVEWSYVDDHYRGLGLGKKFYGEVMKQMPGGVLNSDSSLSPEALGVWKGMGRRGYEVSEPALSRFHNNLGEQKHTVFGSPHFEARLPEPARKALGIEDLSMKSRVRLFARNRALPAARAGLAAGKVGLVAGGLGSLTYAAAKGLLGEADLVAKERNSKAEKGVA